MAAGEGSTEPDDEVDATASNGVSTVKATVESDEENEDEEEDEPRLKYHPLTKSLSSLYRNGDATSTFLVSGDKLIVGTHNGNIHVLSLPTFQSLRVYHAHSASVSSISISPFPPPLAAARPEGLKRLVSEAQSTATKPSLSPASPGAKNPPQKQQVPNTPSNQIYIATSSIDGNVCVASLIDSKDVQLRNFGRPVQSVALSPDYRNDRNYLSGGQAGNLIFSTGGQAGRTTNATTTGAAAAASGWLGSIGLGTNTGTDKVLHGGEGIISTIKWSLSGRYVIWVNEQGIKIMRSNLHGTDAATEWKRLSHQDKPNRQGWDVMAGVWKARAEWVDRGNLEDDETTSTASALTKAINGKRPELTRAGTKQIAPEEVIVGWGDAVWLFRVQARGGKVENGQTANASGRVEVVTILRTDCIISGVSLYTPNLLLVLAYNESDEKVSHRQASDTPSRRGRPRKQNALEPELRLIDLTTQEEVSADTLTVKNYESLSATDYHLGVLPPMRLSADQIQQGALGLIGSGLGTIGSGLYTGVEVVGQGVWDATLYGPRMLGANRLFSSSGGSIRSGKADGDKASSEKASGYLASWIPSFPSHSKDAGDVATTVGMKIFICSPYDCIAAVKRNLVDRLQWLTQNKRYKDAWELLDVHPEAVGTTSEPSEASSPPMASKASSVTAGSTPQPAATGLADFFADASSISSSNPAKQLNSAAEKEKRRIGELWLLQLLAKTEWHDLAEVAAKVLATTTRWEHWVWIFIRNQKFDEISPVIPTFQVSPPLSPLIYEVLLGHYVSTDRPRFKELLDLWPSDLFDIGNMATAIEDQLRKDITPPDSPEWQILDECLAKLYLAGGHYNEALRCYIRLQDADTALAMIKEYHLVDAISDDIPAFVLLRIPPSQLHTAPPETLESLSSDPITLLVDEALSGVVPPETAVPQLQSHTPPLLLFLFFYLRALYHGLGSQRTTTIKSRSFHHGRTVTSTPKLAADEGRLLVDTFADLAVELFADHDRDLLMDFLQSSTAYTFSTAVAVCERHSFIPELVYLLAKTGQTKKALFLIIDSLADVSRAIAFVKDQNDPELWEDLLEYSMSRPKFISGLLAEVGTSVDPVRLVRRIPEGLEIEGLRNGVRRMLREYDLAESVLEGVQRVVVGEVGRGMESLRCGRRRGVRFDVAPAATPAGSKGQRDSGGAVAEPGPADAPPPAAHQPGHCAACGATFTEAEKETLVGFACGHVYHLSHLLRPPSSWGDEAPPLPERPASASDEDELDATFTRSVGPKVTTARLLRDRIEAVGGCGVCRERRKGEEDEEDGGRGLI